MENNFEFSESSSPLLGREPVPMHREAGGEVKREAKYADVL